MNQFNYKPIRGSSRPAFRGSREGKPAATDSINVTLQLRASTKKSFKPGIFAGRVKTRSEIKSDVCASEEDIQIVIDFVQGHDLWIDKIDPYKRLITVRGCIRDVEQTFKVNLSLVRQKNRTYRVREGVVSLPEGLHEIITGVFGLDERPQSRPHIERCMGFKKSPHKPFAFDGRQMAEIYQFPKGDGAGQTIGVIELGGGLLFEDMHTFFGALHLEVPDIRFVSVEGATNSPSSDSGADAEVALDVQVCGAAAPKAKLVIYYAPNTDSGFLQAVLAAIHDDRYRPSVISISWGMAESGWTEQSMAAMNDAFQTAAALGITIFAAAGDDGASDDQNDGNPHVDFPASSPWVTACGGTTLLVAGGIRREHAWNAGPRSATGGGISEVFARPIYQSYLTMPLSPMLRRQGRGLPDISGAADPNSGYVTFLHKNWQIFGGTSAVAPLFAAMTVLLNQRLSKPVGFLNRHLYSTDATQCFFDVVEGDNSSDQVRGYFASTGWDPATGLGVPNGAALLQLIDYRFGLEAA